MNSTERVVAYRERQKKSGRLKREYYLSDSEHQALKLFIKELRSK